MEIKIPKSKNVTIINGRVYFSHICEDKNETLSVFRPNSKQNPSTSVLEFWCQFLANEVTIHSTVAKFKKKMGFYTNTDRPWPSAALEGATIIAGSSRHNFFRAKQASQYFVF